MAEERNKVKKERIFNNLFLNKPIISKKDLNKVNISKSKLDEYFKIPPPKKFKSKEIVDIKEALRRLRRLR